MTAAPGERKEMRQHLMNSASRTGRQPHSDWLTLKKFDHVFNRSEGEKGFAPCFLFLMKNWPELSHDGGILLHQGHEAAQSAFPHSVRKADSGCIFYLSFNRSPTLLGKQQTLVSPPSFFPAPLFLAAASSPSHVLMNDVAERRDDTFCADGKQKQQQNRA